MKKHIKAVIFDHDNTIAHTEPLWVEAAADALKKRSITLAPKEYEQLEHDLLGLGLVPLVQLLIEQFSLTESSERLQKELRERILERYQTKLTFIPGFQEFLQRVQQKNIKIAIASNSDADSLSFASHKLGLQDIFQGHIYSADHVAHPKPAPDLYLLAARKLGVDPSECIAIEDSLHGIAAAQSAGIFCIGITTSKKRGMVATAHLIVDSYDEIDLTHISY